MGIFDFLKGKSGGKSTPPPGGSSGGPVDKKVAGPAKVVAEKRAQTYDRIEAIQTLVDMQAPEAAAALLKRFTFSIDPSITDQEEKDLAFQGIVGAGRGDVDKLPKDEKEREKVLAEIEARRDLVVDAVRAFCIKAEQLTWPLKVLRELLDQEEYVGELIDLLEKFDTEYSRNVEPKVQLIMALEDAAPSATEGDEAKALAGEVRSAVRPFLEDVNETVRFHAVQTTFAQGHEDCVSDLVKLLAAEESVRVKNKVGEGLLQRSWKVPGDLQETTREALRDTEIYGVDGSGKITARGR